MAKTSLFVWGTLVAFISTAIVFLVFVFGNEIGGGGSSFVFVILIFPYYVLTAPGVLDSGPRISIYGNYIYLVPVILNFCVWFAVGALTRSVVERSTTTSGSILPTGASITPSPWKKYIGPVLIIVGAILFGAAFLIGLACNQIKDFGSGMECLGIQSSFLLCGLGSALIGAIISIARFVANRRK